MRKFALFVFAVIFVGSFAHAQQLDIAAGGGTLLSTKSLTDSVTFQPPPLKNGTYVNINGDYIPAKRHFGLEAETAWRYHKADYLYNDETYRPFLSSVNLLYERRLPRKFRLDLLAGLGVASTRFYNATGSSCNNPTVGCVNYTSSNHFMEDLGIGVRYNFWRNFFVRPEVRYYYIDNNVEFNSSSVFRVGVSLGYTFHPKK